MRWVRLFRAAARSAVDDDLLNWSAALSYYFLFALFPTVLLIAALLGTFRLQALTQNLIVGLGRHLPHLTAELVSTELSQLLSKYVPGLISLGIVLLLYAASQGFIGLMAALNASYGVPETRPYYRRILISFGLTFSVGVFVSIALALVVLGQRVLVIVAGPVHAGPAVMLLWPVIRWLVTFGLMVLAVRMLYRFAPNHGHSPSGVYVAVSVALAIWVAASAGFAYYMDHFNNYARVYGSLGAVIALMLWFYIFAISLLFGAELHNAWLKEYGVKAEVPLPIRRVS